VPGVISLSTYSPPAYCHQCGAAYPWTTTRLEAARELARESDRLDDNEKGVLSRSLDDLVRETPNTPVAIARFKKLVAKAGGTVAESLKSILVEIVSEAVKKQIWP
jgi:hypothetical protein